MKNAEILVIDDEIQMRRLLEITLKSHDYVVKEAATAKEGLIAAANHPPDLIILDIALPDESGHVVLKKLREWYNKSIIMLSVQKNEEDIVKALDNGANDYLVKPFRTAELLARIRSTLRTTSSEKNNSHLDCGDLQIDLTARMVTRNNEIVKFTSTEYTLFALFALHEGKVLTHQYLLMHVWGPGFINESQYLRVYIAQIRKKIEDNPNKPVYLVTESGVGYRFVGRES
jgi:two-component system KDP operon response regulator KdpE